MTREGDVDLSVLSCELHHMKNFLHAIISISQKFLLMVSDQGEKEEFSFRLLSKKILPFPSSGGKS